MFSHDECCAGCPSREEGCSGLKPFCEWMTEEPQDPVKVAAVRARSRRDREGPAARPYPPVLVQAGNALVAAGRVVSAVVRGEPVMATAEEQARRLAICVACPEYDPDASRCRKCGCHARAKLSLAASRCPLDPPRW